MERYPPSKEILEKAPTIDRVPTEYFDLSKRTVMPITNDVRLLFFVIVRENMDLYYKIAGDYDSIDKLSCVVTGFVLGTKVPLQYADNISCFFNNLLDRSQGTKEKQDVEIELSYDDSRVVICYEYNGLPLFTEYKSESVSFTECFLYEYFRRISKIDYTNMFCKTDSSGLVIRGSDITLSDFVEYNFGSLFGHFIANTDDPLSPLFDAAYDWKDTVTIVADSLNTNRNEFLLMLNTIPISYDSRELVKLNLAAET